MAHFDSHNAECFVLTYVKGALSAMGHDLKIRVGKFSIGVDDESNAIQATFEPSSLKVQCAMKNGDENRGALSDKDKNKIQKSMRDDVLEPDRYQKIELQSKSVEKTNGSYRVKADLTLHGKTNEISFEVKETDDRYRTEVTLQQPDFGIKPFKAALGGLQLKPEIEVVVSAEK